VRKRHARDLLAGWGDLCYDPGTMPQNTATRLFLLGLLAWISASCFATTAPAPQNCTTFLGVEGTTVLVGNNEDYGNPVINVWFLPASDEKHGRFLIGTEGIIQGGMNEHGLVYDSLTMPSVEVAADERVPYVGMWPIRVLETCSTIEEVLGFYQAHSFPGIWNGKTFFGDASGDAVLIEGDAIVRKSGRFLVSTNFLQSRTEPEDVTCERFLTATEMLEKADAFSDALFRDILDAVHAEYRGGSGTIYSTVYDLGAKTITCYLYYDYAHSVGFDLREELALGPHAYEFHTLFPENPAYEAWRAKELDVFARQVASLRDERVDPKTYDATVGHYAVTSDELFSYPPLALDSFSVVRLGDRLCLVPCPERLSFELFPLGGDRFRSASMNTGTDFDVDFQRDASGDVIGARFLESAVGVEVALEKVSDAPVFEPLAGFMVDLPDVTAEVPGASPRRSLSLWLGVGLAMLGLVGLALVLFP
jgi:hypothetical protein